MTARAARFTKNFDKCGQVASEFRQVGHGGAQAVSERTDETHLLHALVHKIYRERGTRCFSICGSYIKTRNKHVSFVVLRSRVTLQSCQMPFSVQERQSLRMNIHEQFCLELEFYLLELRASLGIPSNSKLSS